MAEHKNVSKSQLSIMYKNTKGGAQHSPLTIKYKKSPQPKKHKDPLIGKRIKVFWDTKRTQLFGGKVTSARRGFYRIEFDDGDEKWMNLDQVEYVEEANAEATANAEAPTNAEAATNAEASQDDEHAAHTLTTMMIHCPTNIHCYKFCLHSGPQCAPLPSWARYCSSCGGQQF